MFVQVIDIFEYVTLHGPRDSNIINQAPVDISLSVLLKTKYFCTRLKWITYSQSPTPPACGHTGTPNLWSSVAR